MMKLEPQIDTGEFANIFLMNAWSVDIPETARNTIVSNALNHCVVNNDFFIIGYLLMNRCLFLIGYSTHLHIEKALEKFYFQVALEIQRYHSEQYKIYQQENVPFLKTGSYEHLFKKYEFRDYYIKNLILGREVEIPYYDPRLARLKDYIHDYNYCSALDYAGGKSPVFVAVKRKN